ncbi:hypothetical protein JIG36_33065 [Actinoplanes sp. LDG1-06]|uniref:Uncharacterized protein n=1 Tax=Paractinoplanes ovalisporus TaxID=2810368 RepID=A0ABS2AKH8_9ACTN|nr:hypothetical protein [Actinoplanes ovalisporus]MBM2620353.1 hypothetical protein [Actinoplanes ovalisporus]
MPEPLSPWWADVHDATQLLTSQLNALVAHAARVGVYTPPPGSPPPRRRRQPASLRHLAEVIRTHRLAPGLSVDKDDVAAVLAGDPSRVTDPALVVAIARAAHLIAGEPFPDGDADRLAVAGTHVSTLLEAARRADERAPSAVPALQVTEPVVLDGYFTTRRPRRWRAPIAGLLGALVLAGVTALVVPRGQEPDKPTSPPAPVAPGMTPLDHAAAHDDYLNPQPLQDALAHRFTSFEADVVLREGNLELCHHLDGGTCRDPRNARITARPFEATYLRGLSSRVNATGGRVYPGYHQPVLLFVEIGCATAAGVCALPEDPAAAATDPNNPLVVARKIMDALTPYREMLFHVDGTARQWGPVQVVITGSHNDDQLPAGGDGHNSVRGLLAQQADTYAFLDGSFGVDRDQYNADLVPVISFPSVGMNEDCTYNANNPLQTKHWDNITKAQSTGHHVRVLAPDNCPGGSDFWTDALYGGVDLISSNGVASLGDWIATNAAGGGGGNCSVPTWIPAARLKGQNCTLDPGDIPVMSRPDPNSGPVGNVAGGGTQWFLGQQPGEPYDHNSTHNFWWAYTQAGNGRWGWVSVLYFSGGVLDQSAVGLQYGCYDVRPGERAECHPL